MAPNFSTCLQTPSTSSDILDHSSILTQTNLQLFPFVQRPTIVNCPILILAFCTWKNQEETYLV